MQTGMTTNRPTSLVWALTLLALSAWGCTDGILGGSRRILVQPFDSTYVMALPVPGLAYRVELRQAGFDSLSAEVTITNRSEETVRLIWGSCVLGLVVYRDEARTKQVPPGRQPEGVFCPGYLKVVDLEPGASHRAREFRTTKWMAEVGDRLSVGQYFVLVTLKLNQRHTLKFPAGRVLIW